MVSYDVRVYIGKNRDGCVTMVAVNFLFAKAALLTLSSARKGTMVQRLTYNQSCRLFEDPEVIKMIQQKATLSACKLATLADADKNAWQNC